jgi:hypothetical protein
LSMSLSRSSASGIMAVMRRSAVNPTNSMGMPRGWSRPD